MADLNLIRGDTKTITLIYQDNSGTAIDITGYTVFFTIKTDPDDDSIDSNAIIMKNIISHTNPTNGTTLISLSNTDTDIDPGLYVADIQIKDINSNITSSNKFSVSVSRDITRRTS